MRTRYFWLAVGLSGLTHLSLVGVLCAGTLWSAFFAPLFLDSYGNSDRDGFPEVSAVTLNPGTFRHGDQHTPGADDRPASPVPLEPPTAPPPIPEKPAPTQPAEAPPPPEQPPEPAKAAPEAAPPTPSVHPPHSDPRPAKGPESSPGPSLPGQRGGARFALGTPSAGGTVGSPTGLRMLGNGRPKYPPAALAAGITGRPVIWMLISTEGTVLEARVHRSSGHAVLDEAALAWARMQHFVPARLGGTPVEWPVLKAVSFSID